MTKRWKTPTRATPTNALPSTNTPTCTPTHPAHTPTPITSAAPSLSHPSTPPPSTRTAAHPTHPPTHPTPPHPHTQKNEDNYPRAYAHILAQSLHLRHTTTPTNTIVVTTHKFLAHRLCPLKHTTPTHKCYTNPTTPISPGNHPPLPSCPCVHTTIPTYTNCHRHPHPHPHPHPLHPDLDPHPLHPLHPDLQPRLHTNSSPRAQTNQHMPARTHQHTYHTLTCAFIHIHPHLRPQDDHATFLHATSVVFPGTLTRNGQYSPSQCTRPGLTGLPKLSTYTQHTNRSMLVSECE